MPVVHADETGWREDGHNGYVWTFSTPTERYFLRRGRGKAVVDEVLGDQFAGVLVSDFYAAYHHYDGPKQRCWAHLLRDIHDLRALYPDDDRDDDRLAQWADAIHQLYRQATAFTHPSDQQRPEQQRPEQQRPPPNWPWNSACWPSAVPTRMTHRPPQPGCADAWRTTSRNSSSLWLNQKSRRTTTPPSAACDRW